MRAKHSSKYGRKMKKRKKVATFFVFFTVLVNLTAKHSSNREIQKRKVDLECKTSIQHKNTTKISRSVKKKSPNQEIQQKNLVKYVRTTKKCRKIVTFLVFFAMLMNLRAKHP